MKDNNNILLIAVSPGIVKILKQLGINAEYIECLETGI